MAVEHYVLRTHIQQVWGLDHARSSISESENLNFFLKHHSSSRCLGCDRFEMSCLVAYITNECDEMRWSASGWLQQSGPCTVKYLALQLL